MIAPNEGSFGGYPERGRPPGIGAESSSSEMETPEMIAGSSDFAAMVAALTDHTRAIGNLVATLTPKVPDFVGTDYIASRLGCTTQWVAKMAENGDIPKACIAPKISGGRIWQFHRDAVDAWFNDLRKGGR